MRVKLLIIYFFLSLNFIALAQVSNITIGICALPSLNLINKPFDDKVIEKSKSIFFDFNNRGLLIDYKLNEKLSITTGLFYEANSSYSIYQDSSYNWHFGYIKKNTFSTNLLYIPLWLNYKTFSFKKIKIHTYFGVNKASWYSTNIKYIYYPSYKTLYLSDFEENENMQGFLYEDFDINLLIKLDYSINKRFGIFLFPLIGYNNIQEGLSKYGLKFNLGFGVSIK